MKVSTTGIPLPVEPVILPPWFPILLSLYLVPHGSSVCFLLSMTVKEKLTADPDSEIATTSLRVSLLCPVSITSLK